MYMMYVIIFYRYTEIVAAKTVCHLHVHMYTCGRWFRENNVQHAYSNRFPSPGTQVVFSKF